MHPATPSVLADRICPSLVLQVAVRAPWALEALTSELESALRHGLRLPRDDRLVWALDQLRQGLRVGAAIARVA